MAKREIIIVIVSVVVIVFGMTLYLKNNFTFRASGVAGVGQSFSLGKYLTDTKGMTLYVFTDDKKLESTCEGDCLQAWPVFEFNNKNLEEYSDGLSARFNVIKRKDGWAQYAYGDQPLYYYAGDKNPGDAKGNGLENGKWKIVLLTE